MIFVREGRALLLAADAIAAPLQAGRQAGRQAVSPPSWAGKPITGPAAPDVPVPVHAGGQAAFVDASMAARSHWGGKGWATLRNQKRPTQTKTPIQGISLPALYGPVQRQPHPM